MGSGSVPSSHNNRFPMSRKGPTPIPAYLITTAASLRAGGIINSSSFLHASFKELSHIVHGHGFKDTWCGKAVVFKGLEFFDASRFSASSLCFSCISYFGKSGSTRTFRDGGKSYMETPERKAFNGRLWTNVLLAINVLVYVAQLATHGKLMLWGAKINSLIDKGQLWRLATSSFLHANVGHLMVNCYSLNSVGPTMEMISGPRRFLAVYFTSAVASCAASYWFCKAPAVGASGAIFGVVGSFAVFVLRHRTLFGGGKEDLQQIARVIALNMLGGLLGGAAVSWFLGPAWTYESKSADGRSVYTDKAPIFYLTRKRTAG